MDAALGSPESLRQRIRSAVRQAVGAGRPVILPVPRHGRGLELICLLHDLAYLRLDDQAREAVESIPQRAEWFKGPLPPLSALAGSIHLISDSQLKQPGISMLAERLMEQEESLVVMTGYL